MKPRILVLILMLSAVALAASCRRPPPPEPIWQKADVSHQQLKTDEYQCLQESMTGTRLGIGTKRRISDQRLFKACMGARGYRDVTPPPAGD